MNPPKYVLKILERLTRRGYAAYMVGGCVRDMLIGRRPLDWDICTAALPEEVAAVFPRSRPTGVKHGTVTVCIHGAHAEVTTFRSDGVYTDHRRPDSVRFVGALKDDLARRDFTVNALALPLSGEVVDLFGGKRDLENKLLCCVGDPNKRFEEDALRMLRAFRFAAVLGFEIEANTLQAIKSNAPLAAALAKERVRAEIERILLSPAPETISDMAVAGLLRDLVHETATLPDLSVLKRLPKKSKLRWAGLCILLEKSAAIDGAAELLTALRLDSVTIRCCSAGCNLVKNGAPADEIAWKRLLAAYGTETADCAAAASEVLFGVGHFLRLKAVIKSGDCYSLGQLAVTGDDLAKLGFAGPKLGATLWELLDHVIMHPGDNEKAQLMKLAVRVHPKLL